jgi:quinoprotein relay system zinc metallohydrolase 2
MLDVLATLCLLAAPDACAGRVVPVGAPDCAAAMEAAAPRLDAWRTRHAVTDVTCARWEGAPLLLTEIAPGVHVHAGEVAEPSPANLGDVANLVIVVGEEAVAVIDAGGSRGIGERVVATVRALTDRPIAAVVLTHMHPDHVFGATALADAGAEVIGHEALPLALAARAETYETAFLRLIGPGFVGSETPVSDRGVADAATLDLGGRSLRLTAWPTAHTAADHTGLDQATGTLDAGDLVSDTHAPALDGSLVGWQAVLERLGELRPQRVVPGHGATALPWPEGGEGLRRYLEVLAHDTREAIRAGATLSESVATAARSEATRWELFDLFNPRNATAAYPELEWE